MASTPFILMQAPPDFFAAAVAGKDIAVPTHVVEQALAVLNGFPCIGCGIDVASSVYIAIYEASPAVIVPCCDACNPARPGADQTAGSVRANNRCRVIFEGKAPGLAPLAREAMN